MVKLFYCFGNFKIAGLVLLLIVVISSSAGAVLNANSSIKTKHIVGLEETNINQKNIQTQSGKTVLPGDTIFIQAGKRKVLRVDGFHGDSLNNIVFTNLGGDVVIENNDNNNLNYGISIINCSYFRFTGTGNSDSTYGIKVLKTREGASGLSIDQMSTNFEIDHIEIANTGFAGIFSISQPTCDETSNRGNFVQRDVSFHDNYIHNTWGEGMYIGHSFYSGYTKICDGVSKVLYPHEIQGLKVYNNRVDSSGWDGIQVSSANIDCKIYNNVVTNYGTKNEESQKAGIQIGSGTTGLCYNNAILNGNGSGINVFGTGNNIIYNNIIVNAGKMIDTIKIAYGIFCDDRFTTPGAPFHFINNTIINPATDGIRMYSTESKNNKFYNNLILKPGSISNYKDVTQSYVYINPGVDADISNNYFSQNLPTTFNYDSLTNVFQYTSTLPVYNIGRNVSEYGIIKDFNNLERSIYGNYDIGAYQFSSYLQEQKKSLLPQIYIYPNPNHGTFLIVNNALAPIKKITIYNANALKIHEQSFALNDYLKMDFKDIISKGLYIMKTETLNEEFSSYFIVY